MKKYFAYLFFLSCFWATAQINRNDTIRVENHPRDSVSAAATEPEIKVLADIRESNTRSGTPVYNPTRAGLYSAVLPGLGQYYNKKYWKIPIVLGAIGTGAGFIIYNDRQYKRYRKAFIAELNGQPHEFSGIRGVDKNALGNIQDQAKRQRDYAIAISGLIYILNIVDAVVDAHLYQGRHDPDLALRPAVMLDGRQRKAQPGLSFNYRF